MATKPKRPTTMLAPARPIETLIQVIRRQKVMLDRDLAALYGVKPIALRQQVKRNQDRFPADFMFQLTAEEADLLVSQSVIPSRRSLGGYLPYAFNSGGHRYAVFRPSQPTRHPDQHHDHARVRADAGVDRRQQGPRRLHRKTGARP